MAHEYIFRANKPKFRYHIACGKGTLCRMEKSTAFKLLDTRSGTPPASRKLCASCALKLPSRGMTS